MTTARDIITSSLRLIQEVGAGESISAESAEDGLSALIRMISNWSVNRDVIYTQTREVFPLVAGQSTYTIGAGGDFDTVAPNGIQEAFLTNGNITYNLDIVGWGDYARNVDKTVSGIPFQVYFDGNTPLASMIFYYVPSLAFTLNLYSFKPLTAFTSINEALAMPASYERALVYNLACEIAPEYGKEAPQSVQKTALISLRAIESANVSNNPSRLSVDAALLSGSGTFNIFSGE